MSHYEQIGSRLESIAIALALAEEHKIALPEALLDGVNAIGTLLVASIVRKMKWSEAEMLRQLVAKRRAMRSEYDTPPDPIEALKRAFAAVGLDIDAAIVPAEHAASLKDAIMQGNLQDVAKALAKDPKKER